MEYSITASITPSAAARLLITNEISLESYWQLKQAESVLAALINTPVYELLYAIDNTKPDLQPDPSSIPQFGSLKMLIRVPEIMVSTGLDGLSFTQLGFYLKGDIEAKQSANAKYGETHGKGACLLGIAVCQKSRIHFGAFTNAFNYIAEDDDKITLSKLLCLRIPIIQTLLHYARTERVNGFLPMSHLEQSTRLRRSICIKMILRELHTLHDCELSKRIENIYWKIDEEDSPNAEV